MNVRCPKCGAETSAESKFCTSCGAELNAGGQTAVTENQPKIQKKSRKKKILIAIAVIIVAGVIALIYEGNTYIKEIKTATPSNDNTTIEEMLSEISEGKIKWSHSTEGDSHIVTAKFKGSYFDDKVDWEFKFWVVDVGDDQIKYTLDEVLVDGIADDELCDIFWIAMQNWDE